MNRTGRWLMAAALLAAAAQGFADPNELARPRIWTSASGAQLMAVFVEVSDDAVVLRKRDGERLRIVRTKLSAADQSLLDEAFGPVAAEPPPPAEFATPAPAPESAEVAAAPESSPAPAPPPFVVAGTEIRLGEKTVFRAPLEKDAIADLKKAGNETTEAVVGLWTPPDFDPRKEWSILLVSQTANASSVDHMDCYLESARNAPGWILLAADAPAPPPNDTTQGRWQMARAGLLALEAAWPGARRWPIAAGGFSGGAKRSGLLGALLCKHGWNLIGMYMGGCDEDMASEGLRTYQPDRLAFRKVPVFLGAGKKDEVAPVMKVNQVRLSMESIGFRDVRMETCDSDHNPNGPQITEALNWFEEMRAKRAASPAGARPSSRLPRPPPAPAK